MTPDRRERRCELLDRTVEAQVSFLASSGPSAREQVKQAIGGSTA